MPLNFRWLQEALEKLWENWRVKLLNINNKGAKMIWGVFAFALAVYGYFQEETFALGAGIVVGIIGIRRTVLNLDKIGTFINIVMVFVVVTLGALVYFFDEDTRRQEITKASVPRAVQPAVVQPLTVKPTQTPQTKERDDLEK